jgi:hypothetical protein
MRSLWCIPLGRLFDRDIKTCSYNPTELVRRHELDPSHLPLGREQSLQSELFYKPKSLVEEP